MSNRQPLAAVVSTVICVLAAALVVVVTAAPVAATTLHVPVSYPTIQAGLDAASAGDTVLVAPGTYTDWAVRGTRSACAFLPDGVILRSESGSGVTTIDMQGQGSTQPDVIVGILLLSGQTVVEGFAVTGAPPGAAGAFLVDCAKITFRDCTFRDMDGVTSAAGIGSRFTDLEIVDCDFTNLRTTTGSAGAIAVQEADVVMDGCLFTNCVGGAVTLLTSLPPQGPTSAVVQNSAFVGNTSGTAALNIQLTNASVINCYFEGNLNKTNGALGIGVPGTWSVLGCTFLDNACTSGSCAGGALNTAGASGTLMGCTFEGSSGQSVLGGSAVKFSTGSGTVLFSHNAISNSTGPFAVRPRPESCGKEKWRSLRVLAHPAPDGAKNRRTTPCRRIARPPRSSHSLVT